MMLKTKWPYNFLFVSNTTRQKWNFCIYENWGIFYKVYNIWLFLQNFFIICKNPSFHEVSTTCTYEERIVSISCNLTI